MLPTKSLRTLTLFSDGAEATFLLGEKIGCAASGGEVIGLIGPLGSGKTVFVQGLATGLGIAETPITSPTFVIMNLYQTGGRLPLCHVDLYRLEDSIETIGLSEYLDWNGVTVIEWADKGLRESVGLMIAFDDQGEDKRRVTLTGNATHRHLVDGIEGGSSCHKQKSA